jgi:Na+-transporting NADH:ubiquinone oxidoreductase subunit A
MTPRFRIRQGLDIPVSGRPRQSIRAGRDIAHVALCGPDYMGLKPRLLVAEGDEVSLGQPLFIDKRDPGIPFVSPGTGRIVAIHRGPRRALHSVVVRLADSAAEDFRYEPLSSQQLQKADRSQIAERLRESGLWTAFRTRPFSRVPVSDSVPRSIFVTAIDTRPLAADPRVVLRERIGNFNTGLHVLSRLTDGRLFLNTAPDWPFETPDIERLQHVEFSGPHPAGLPGTHIHLLDPVGEGRTVWHISYQEVLAIGRLFGEGVVDYRRVIAVGGACVPEPSLVETRLGAAVDELTGDCIDVCEGNRSISGSVLGGRTASAGLGFLGRYHHQVAVIPEGGDRHLFGWTGVFPWRYSAARTFLRQAGHRRRRNITTAQNGRFTGLLPTRAFEKVLPLDILPSPLFRALLVRDTDEATALGCLELDEEDLALCSFVCPAKKDYGTVLRINLEQIEKEGG